MKKITYFITILTFLVIDILFLAWADNKEAAKYLQFETDDVKAISLKYNEDIAEAKENLKTIMDMASQNHVILMKSNIDEQHEKGTKLYVSVENIDALKFLLEESFAIQYLNLNSSKDSFVVQLIKQTILIKLVLLKIYFKIDIILII